MQTNATIEQIIQFVEQNGVLVEKERHGFLTTGVDMVLPHINLLLCLRGTYRIQTISTMHASLSRLRC